MACTILVHVWHAVSPHAVFADVNEGVLAVLRPVQSKGCHVCLCAECNRHIACMSDVFWALRAEISDSGCMLRVQTPVAGSNVTSVAEDEVMRILVLIRNFLPARDQIVKGDWDVPKVAVSSWDLMDKTVGTVGGGRIGYHMMKRLRVSTTSSRCQFSLSPFCCEVHAEGLDCFCGFDVRCVQRATLSLMAALDLAVCAAFLSSKDLDPATFIGSR